MKLFNFLKNRTIKNAGWIIGGRVMNKLLAFFVGILTARYLGPGNYGLINYAATYTTFFSSLCTLGINSIIIKDFIAHPDEQGEAIGTTLTLRAISALLSALMTAGIVFIADSNEPLTILVVILSSIGLFFQIFDTFSQWFQSRLQSKYAAMATVVSYIVVSGYKIALLALGKSVVWFAVATSIDYIVVAFFLLLAYKRNNGPSLSFSWRKAKQLLKESSGFIISGLMVSVYASTDRLMLKQLMDETVVGYYGVAVSLSTTWGFILQAVIDSVYPSVVQAYERSESHFNRRNKQLYAVVIYFAGAVSLALCLLAEPIILILYGQEYAPAIAPLRIVVWYTAFSYLGVARNAWMVCKNKQKYLTSLYVGAAVINICLNMLLIPALGAVGAAWASLLTQVSTAVILPLIIKPLRPNVGLMLDALMLKDVL